MRSNSVVQATETATETSHFDVIGEFEASSETSSSSSVSIDDEKERAMFVALLFLTEMQSWFLIQS